MQRRWLNHIIFWIVFWMINSYLQFYMGISEGSSPFWKKLLLASGAELTVMPLRMAVAYVSMYYFLPKYFEGRNYGKLIVSAIVLLALALIAYRLIVETVVYPFVYQEVISEPRLILNLPRLVWAGLDFASVAGITASIKLVRMRLKTLEREKQLVEEKLQSELSFLRAQTNPHFLFNTLNNIYALARKQSESTAPIVLKLSKMLRFMLYDCTRPRIGIGEEARVIRDFIELEELRYNKRLKVDFIEEIDDKQQQIAPLLLLPLVENAFKHGASESRFLIQIQLKLKLEAGQLHFYIHNSKDSDTTNEHGIGLRNVRRQLELIYPEAHELKIDNGSDEFAVNLHIDLNKDQEILENK